MQLTKEQLAIKISDAEINKTLDYLFKNFKIGLDENQEVKVIEKMFLKNSENIVSEFQNFNQEVDIIFGKISKLFLTLYEKFDTF